MTTLPPTSPSKPYSQIRSQLGTGDIFFLHGTSAAGVMIEKLEELAHWPPFSHVGMVVKDGNDLYLFDAPGGGDCFPDPYSSDRDNRTYGWPGTPVHAGLRVSVLDDVLAYYITKVDVGGFWLRQLTPAVTQDRFEALRRFINRVDGMSFPAGPGKDPDTQMESGLGFSFAAGQDRGSLYYGTYFCAQLVADAYMHMGLLEMEVFPPNGYSPAAFGMNDPSRLRLVAPATLEDVLFVKWDGPVTKSGTPCPTPPPPPQPAQGA
jgi:hypothetical protein